MYTEQPKNKSVCKLCGDTQAYWYSGKGKNKNKMYPLPYYYRVFDSDGAGRGDDTYFGIICKQCIKDGRLGEMSQ